MSEVVKTLQPGDKGTGREVEIFGGSLVRVRYRRRGNGARYKTVEVSATHSDFEGDDRWRKDRRRVDLVREGVVLEGVRAEVIEALAEFLEAGKVPMEWRCRAVDEWKRGQIEGARAGRVAEVLGVSVRTLARWERERVRICRGHDVAAKRTE